MRAAIERHQALPFQWGVSDCAVMCGDVMRAVTGRHVLKGYRWASERGAIVELRRAGFATAIEFFTSGLDEIDPAMAMRGDIGVVDVGAHGLSSPAIIDGAWAFSKNTDGAVMVPATMIVRAWAA